jgi:hypothetical protein
MTAWINGFLGLFSSLLIGTQVLGLTPLEVMGSFVASVAAGWVAVFFTLKGERTPWLRKYVMSNSKRTWVVFLSLYFCSVVLLAPPIRDLRVFSWMIIPLILCTGFTIVTFGPLQDRWVARAQRKSRAI